MNKKVFKIIPGLRLPRKLGVFDYLADDEIAKDIKVGSLVEIPFRNKKTFGVVAEIKEKSDTEKNLKNVIKLVPQLSLTDSQLKLIDEFSKNFFVAPATTLNQILNTLPHKLDFLSDLAPSQSKKTSNQKGSFKDSLFIYDSLKNKNSYVFDQVKKETNSRHTVLIVSPEISQVRKLSHELSTFSPAIFHRQLPRYEFWSNYQSLLTNKNNLIIGTRTSLFMPFTKLDLIIIDDEDNPSHRQSDQNPRFHTEQVAAILKDIFNCRIIYTSQSPRTTTYFKMKNDELSLVNNSQAFPEPRLKTINLTNERKLGNYSLLSDQVQAEIHQHLKANKKIFLFHNRRGEASGLFCQDCGQAITCPRCQYKLTVYKASKKSNVLVCHICNYQTNVALTCPQCHSSKLKKTGSGGQKLSQEVKTFFPKSNVALINSFKQWLDKKNKPDIVIGTQKLINPDFINNFDFICVINADSALQIPDFSSTETTFRVLYKLVLISALKKKQIVVQSYKPDHYAIKFANNLNFEKFCEEDLKQRQPFSYPPFSELVRLLLKDKNKDKAAKKAEELFEKINSTKNIPNNIEIIYPSPSYIEKIRGQYRWQLIIKFNKKDLPFVRNLIKLSDDNWLIDLNPLNLLS